MTFLINQNHRFLNWRQKNNRFTKFLKFDKLLLFFFSSSFLSAQSLQPFTPQFVIDNQALEQATVGGLSSPQFSEVDLNNDGILDLYIFDKIGQLSLTYINKGTPNQVDYIYAPEYLQNFPPLFEWVLLRDYNGDNIQDIFAYSSISGIPGVEVYTGYYNAQNQIAFKSFPFNDGQFNIIYYPGSSGQNNLFVSSIDYPAIDDIDEDGDLDIITFNVAGGVVEYYQNQSVERGFGLDSLEFILVDRCWGRFFESGLTKEVDLSNNPNDCAVNLTTSEARDGLHAGSTLLTIDLDNDGDKEVILGDIAFTNLNLVINGGNAAMAFMTSQEIDFPNNSLSVDIPLFPAAFSLDLDNDGAKDLIASPNLNNDIGETYSVVWFYKNTGTNGNPAYEFQQKDLFVEDMLDFGTGAQPVFVDYNQDGLQDLVIGNKSFFVPGGGRNSRVQLFINVGTATQPIFELREPDLFNLNEFSSNAWRFTPTFGDLDQDGDLDALIGEEFGNLFYAENIAGADQPFEFAPVQFGYHNIDVGQVSKPQIIDISRDGLPDLVIGERNGNLNYYENIGTIGNPVFPAAPTNNFFGKVDTRAIGFITGYSAPAILEMSGEYQLFSGSEDGSIRQYQNIEGNLDSSFDLVNTNFGNVKVGGETHISFADIDQDGFLEMAIGNVRGGVSFYQTDLKSNSTNISESVAALYVDLFPNPVSGLLNIQISKQVKPLRLTLFNALGQTILHRAFSNQIDLTLLETGIYLLKIETQEGLISGKIVRN